MKGQCTRRDIVMKIGAAAVAAGSGGQAAAAHCPEFSELSEMEKSNVALLKQMLANFQTPDFDIDKTMAQYMAPNSSVRWTDADAPAVGPQAAAAAVKRLFLSGMRAEIKYLKVLARGPLVATSRVDTIKVPGKPDAIYKVAGAAVIKGGKIQEYCDYIVPDAG
jgi:limonene-1,2-epoxide hydrolase